MSTGLGKLSAAPMPRTSVSVGGSALDRNPGTRPLIVPFRSSRQAGAVLVISLVILLAMTLIGITAVQNSVMEERMAGNLKERATAFQAAEAGLSLAVTWIDKQLDPPNATAGGTSKVWEECATGTKKTQKVKGKEVEDDCPPTTAPDSKWLATSGNYLAYAGGALGNSKALSGVSEQPRIVIEERYAPPLDFEQAAVGKGVYFYTVTSQGYGGTDTAKAMLQTTVAKVYAW